MKTDPAKAMANWSEARIKAYKLIDSNPNSYYYRFNAPGEQQKYGAWNTVLYLNRMLLFLFFYFQEERALFFKRLEEVGANGEWGIFSMTIPGRVGYQVS
jgi:hypothetical protein